MLEHVPSTTNIRQKVNSQHKPTKYKNKELGVGTLTTKSKDLTNTDEDFTTDRGPSGQLSLRYFNTAMENDHL